MSLFETLRGQLGALTRTGTETFTGTYCPSWKLSPNSHSKVLERGEKAEERQHP